MDPRDSCPSMRKKEGAETPREEHLVTVEDNVEGMDQEWAKEGMKEVWGQTNM